MGGKASGGMPTGPARAAGGAGKSGGGGGKGGGGGAMTSDQADAANATRRQNIFTTVGGLSRPGGGPGAPPSPTARPSGPSGPPLPPTRPAGGLAATPGTPTDPLLGRDPLTGALQPYGRSVPGGAQPPGVGSVLPEGMAASPLSQLFQGPSLQASPGGPPVAGADAEARMRRAKKVADFYGPRV